MNIYKMSLLYMNYSISNLKDVLESYVEAASCSN